MLSLLRVELKIPGRYRDAWLYKETLHVWDREGTLCSVTFDDLLKYIRRIHSYRVSNIVQALIFRNDWKVGEQFRSWMLVKEVRDAVFLPFDENETLTIDIPESLLSKSDSESYGGLVLDTNIYANRVYLATAEGLLESYINPKKLEYSYGLNQQTDFRASRIAVKYSAINVSAEARGLHFAPVTYSSEHEAPGFRQADWRQVADFSLASSFAWRNLLNYTRESVPLLLRSKIEETRADGRRYDDKSVVGYEPDPTDISSLTYSATVASKKVTTRKLRQQGPPEPEFEALENGPEFEVLGNADHHLLATWDSQLRVIDLRTGRGRELEAFPNQKFRKRQITDIKTDEIIATYPISGGFVVESYDKLDLITASGSFELTREESAQVRTFDSSIRHKEVIAVVQEESVSVFGFYAVDNSEDALF